METAKVDKGLLMEVMEKREVLEESPTAAQVAALRKELVADISGMLEKLSAAFSSDALQEAAALTVRLQYITKLMAEVETKEVALGMHPSQKKCDV